MWYNRCCFYRTKGRRTPDLMYDADVSSTNLGLKTLVMVMAVSTLVVVAMASPAAPGATVAAAIGVATGSCFDLTCECVRHKALLEELERRERDL